MLNATQVDEGSVPIDAVAGLAAKVADEVIKPAKGFKVGTEETAGSGFDATTIMLSPTPRPRRRTSPGRSPTSSGRPR